MLDVLWAGTRLASLTAGLTLSIIPAVLAVVRMRERFVAA
jgi:hypothetical protein